MSGPADLRAVVARLCGCRPEEISGDFPLDVPALRGSLKKAVLIASIRRYLGVDCMAAAGARTFAELEAMVLGRTQPAAAAPDRAPQGAPRPAGAPPPVPAAGGPACGIDLEAVSALPGTADFGGHPFYQDSFSPEEIAYCAGQAEPRAHFAARWCAKEALVKCDASWRNTPWRELELARSASGAVFLRCRGRALPHAVSVTHTDAWAAAVVVLAPPAPPPPRGWLATAGLAVSLAALVVAAAAYLVALH